MEKLIKLTNEFNQTKNRTQWGENTTNIIENNLRGLLCSGCYLHAYRNIEIALFLNIIHANYYPFIVWEAEGLVDLDDGTKVGCKELKTIKEIKCYIKPTKEQRIIYAIKCLLEIIKYNKFINWAEKWINGTDRKVESFYKLDIWRSTIEERYLSNSLGFLSISISLFNKMNRIEYNQYDEESYAANSVNYLHKLIFDFNERLEELEKQRKDFVNTKINFVEIAKQVMEDY